MSHTQLAAVALAATAFAASGCGSSKTTSSTSASATTASTPTTSSATSTTNEATNTEAGKVLTKTELIAKADAICARANNGLFAAQIKSARDYATIMPQDAAYFRTETAELRKLTPPASMGGDWQQIVAGLQTVAADIAKVGEYAQKNTLALATPVFSAANARRQHVLAIAKRNGFNDCSQVHR